MISTIKEQIFQLACPESARKIGGQNLLATLSWLSVLVLSGLLSLTPPQAVWAIPLLGSVNQSSSGIFMAQQKNTNIPPQVVKAVRQDLSRRTNISTEKLKVQQASEQTWPNGCLGLASPDEICTQALVEGWRVIMSYNDQTWVYRTDSQGRTVRIEN